MENKPRKLTIDEIRIILTQLPRIQGATIEAPKSCRDSMIQKLFQQLREIVITPLAIPKLTAEINRRFYTAQVQVGEPVGNRAAEAISAPVMQTSLNTFHTSGSSKNVSSGIGAINELINATKNRKNTSMSIHFIDKNLTLEEVFAKRVKFVEVNLGSIIEDYEIDNITNYIEPEWATNYLKISGKVMPETLWFMRLKMKVNTMFMHRITMNDVVNVLEIDVPSGIFVIPSSLYEGYIDIFSVEARLGEALSDLSTTGIEPNIAGLLFLKEIVLPNFGSIIVKGVKNIKELFAIDVPVLQIVGQTIHTYGLNTIKKLPENERSEASRTWHLIYNRFNMISTGLTAEKLRYLIEAVGMKYVSETENYMVVVMPEVPGEMILANKNKNLKIPNEFIIAKINANEEFKKNKLEQLKKEGIKNPRIQPNELDRVSTYVYADTNGTNLQEVLAMEEVDSKITITNDFHEVNRVMGIKAARNSLIKEFIDVLTASSYINPRHITLLVDYMTNKGRINAINYIGLSRQSGTVLQKASFEQPLKAFSEASAFGRSELIGGGITASIITGQRPKIGTGMVEVEFDQNRFDELMKEINIAKQFNPVDFENVKFNEVQAPVDEGEDDIIAALVGAPIQPPRAIVDLPTKLPYPVPNPQPQPVKPSQLVRVLPNFAPAPAKLPINPQQTMISTPTLINTQPLTIAQPTQPYLLPALISDIINPQKITLDAVVPQIVQPIKTPVKIPQIQLPRLQGQFMTQPIIEEESTPGFINYHSFLG